ncbi:MAG TPA: diguanylate cyclase [Candidatus Limnocylindrales bacterium]|jgi:diguanylate cyclase (GGDEF)-like protein/PAS domain S-box-containing protein
MVAPAHLQEGLVLRGVRVGRFVAQLPGWPTLARIAKLAPGLPLAAIVVALLIMTRHATTPDLGLIDAGAMALLLLAGVWQTLLVYERGRLLEGARRAHSALEAAYAQAAESDSRYRVLVEHVPAAVYIDVADPLVSDGGRLAYMSPQIETMLGYPPQAFLADPELWPQLIDPQDREQALLAYHEHWQTGRPLRAEYRMVARDGSTIWVRDEAYAMTDGPRDSHRVSQGLLVDTSEQKRLEAQLLHDALHDPLTGLPNRALFQERAERALGRLRRRRTPLAVLFLDVDDFKLINDSLGHAAGDRLLIEIAARLSAAVRPGDTVARQGGDEFTVLLGRVQGLWEAEATAERLATELRRPIAIDGLSLVIGVSVGVALADHSDLTAEELLTRADAAMYTAKAGGKGRHAVFEESMHVPAADDLAG